MMSYNYRPGNSNSENSGVQINGNNPSYRILILHSEVEVVISYVYSWYFRINRFQSLSPIKFSNSRSSSSVIATFPFSFPFPPFTSSSSMTSSPRSLF